ncbi:MAG: hypothetical protein ACKVZJ_00660 [Phycisphaerales bacterium]
MSANPADIVRLLPNADLSRGPFGLLGLGPTRCDDFAIVEALQRQLRRIDESPERATKEADAIRAELYQAVAQLRDPETRDRLGKRYYRQDWVAAPRVEREPSAIAVPQTEPVREAMLAGDPTLYTPRPTIDEPGPRAGFNAGKAAAILLVGSGVMLVILAWLVMQAPSATVPAPAAPRAAMVNAPTPGATVPAVSTPTSAAGEDTTASAAPIEPPRARLSPDESRELLEQLRKACAAEGPTPEIMSAFEMPLAQFEARWPEVPGAMYAPASLAVAERLWRSTRSDVRQGVSAYRRLEQPLDLIGGQSVFLTPEKIVAAAWSGGVLGRVKGDASVPARLVSSARTKLAALTPDGEVPREHTFAAGAGVVLESLARRWARPGAGVVEEDARRAWAAWSRAALALGDAEPGATEAVVGAAVDTLLRNADVEGSPVVREALTTLLGTVKDWRAVPAAQRVIAWFDNPRVRSSSLRVITEWMASRGPVADIGPNMVLEADATSVQRRALRDAYALRLGLSADAGSRSASALVSAWAGAARALLAASTPTASGDPAENALIDAASAAALNEAAARLWAMDEAGASTAIESASRAAIDAALGTAAPGHTRYDAALLTAPGTSPDGEWARKFLALNNESGRVLLLNQLRNGRGPAGPVDADVLAEVACYGSPATVRQTAQATVKDFADRPEVVNAVLEAIPDASRQQSVSEMVAVLTGAALPPPSDASWRADCRKALLEKLMFMTADESGQRADTLASRLARSCEGSAQALVPPGSARNEPDAATLDAQVAGGASTTPADAADGLRARWRELARATPEGSWAWLTFDELERRHAARIALTRGPIDAYLAQRLGGVEMMAHSIAGERPVRAEAPRAVTVELASSLRVAPTSFHQVRAVELSAMRLWMIRFGEPLVVNASPAP